MTAAKRPNGFDNASRGVNASVTSDRLRRLRTITMVVAALLLAKVLLAILYEYRWYFPANFDSSFLIGRRPTFLGAYRVAFYSHIVGGPVTVLLGAFLMASGGRPRWRRLHRIAGRMQILIVLVVLTPSGLVMASQAYTGAIAAVGFATHSLATAGCATAALSQIRAGDIASHRRWACRCFVLLCAPLLLRVISGATIVLEVDSDWTYRVTVWLCWLVPLAIHEAWLRFSRHGDSKSSSPVHPGLTEEAFQ